MERMFLDYQAKLEFLRATTIELVPVPIDTLLSDATPLFCKWLEMLSDEKELSYASYKDAKPVGAHFAYTNLSISGMDDSTQAVALRNSLEEWMARYHFTDRWIASAAATTLFVHKLGKARPREWYLRQTELHLPSAKVPYVENEAEYLESFDQAYRKERKEFVRRLRKANTDYPERARWTAAVFGGASFAAIARRENVQIGEDALRKSVYSFAQRAELTLAETLAEPAGKSGKI